MKIVIDIPDDMYYAIENYYWSVVNEPVLLKSIKDGRPLPEHHGRLIDADALNRKDVNCANVPMNFIDTAPTIIGGSESK